MCHLYMKLSDMFDQNPACTFDKIRDTHSDEKHSHSLTLRAKVKVIAKIKRPQGAINMPSTKKRSRGFVHLLVSNGSVKYVINDLLTITEIGQPRSRVIR